VQKCELRYGLLTSLHIFRVPTSTTNDIKAIFDKK
jgi:hypothetical protein